jgi:SAM-dependent methyltransferase
MSSHPPTKPTPFEQLRGKKYFVPRLSNMKFEEAYWGVVTDPDGVERDRLSKDERKAFLANIGTELRSIHSRTPGRILDVGCGPGYLMSGIDKEWERHGVEISAVAAEYAAQWGKIHFGTLESANYPDTFFDVVVLFHVIEHVPDPAELIREIRRILKVDGLLILGTPDFDAACARRFNEQFRLLRDPTHISLFSEVSLRRFLRDHGYVIEHVDHPFFETSYFTSENLNRLFDLTAVSPPFYGNVITAYCRPMTKSEARDILDHMETSLTEVFGPMTD